MGLFQKESSPGAPIAPTAAHWTGQVVCPKKGVMDPGSHCRSFRYDPLKRVPPRPPSRRAAPS